MAWQQKCKECGAIRVGNSTSTCPNGCNKKGE